MKIQHLPLVLALGCSIAVAAESPSIAVVDFTSSRPTTAQTILPDLISDGLVNSGRYNVLEREKLQSVLHEQNFQASGVSDPATAVAFGKLAGVHYLITGKILDSGAESRVFSGYGVQTRTTIHHLQAAVRVMDVATAKVLFSRTEGAEETVNESSGMRVEDSSIERKLAEAVSAKMVAALLSANPFGADSTSAATPVTVHVKSVPANADVEVDGVFFGNANSDLKLPPGLHAVTISLPGFEKWSKKVQVQEGLSIVATLEKKADVRIEVKTSP